MKINILFIIFNVFPICCCWKTPFSFRDKNYHQLTKTINKMSQFNDQNLGDLLKAVGQGQGKHGSFDKRNRTNKYDNGPPPDPFVVAFGESFGSAEINHI